MKEFDSPAAMLHNDMRKKSTNNNDTEKEKR